MTDSPSEDFTSLAVMDVSSPLGQVEGWVLIDNGDDTEIFALWGKAFQDLFESSARHLQDKWPLPKGVQAYAVFSGDRTAMDWNGDTEGMGFHALLARFHDENDGGEYLDVPDAHICHVNLRAHDRECRDDIPDEASVLAALATLPHEMAHVALFARHTGGKTPLEVFDEGDGEITLGRILKELEEDAIEQTGTSSDYGGNEDVVENFATATVDQWYDSSPAARELVADLVASLQPVRRARPRP